MTKGLAPNRDRHAAEQLLVKLAPKCFAPESGLPTLSHCIGQDRLLGEYYGDFLAESLGLKEPLVRKDLTELCILMRSFIVLDDFLRDKVPDRLTEKYIKRWTRKIAERCTQLVSCFTGSDKLWTNYLMSYENAYWHYSFQRPFFSTMDKCSFLFLPFDLDIFLSDEERRNQIKQFVKYFLFSLQLVDDFHDMEEDDESPKNHNLFTGALESIPSRWVMQNRFYLVDSLLSYIKENLMRVKLEGQKTPILSTFFQNSINWIEFTKRYIVDAPSTRLFQGRFERYKLDEQLVQRWQLDWQETRQFDYSRITAEGMHSLTDEVIR